MFTQRFARGWRLARSRSRRNLDSFERSRGEISNPRERRIALAGLSSDEKQAMLYWLAATLGGMEVMPFSQRRNDLTMKLDIFKNFLDYGDILDGWIPPSRPSQTRRDYIVLRQEVRDFHLGTIVLDTSEWPVLVGPGLLNGEPNRIERAFSAFTGRAYKIELA